MDTFLEYLVKKKDMPKDILLKILIILLAFLVSGIVFIAFTAVSLLRSFSFIAAAAVLYGAYILLQRNTIEYEYIFTNGDLDIDIIRGKRFRSRIASIKCKDIEHMEKIGENEPPFLKKDGALKNVNAVYNPENPGIYKIAGFSAGERINIMFQPPEKLVEAMIPYNPRNIIK